MFRGPEFHSPPPASRLRGVQQTEPSCTLYRFEDVEVHDSEGCLKKAGAEVYIRQQSFHVLLYLLEHRSRVVAKDELVSKFWRDTAVTDNAVVQCITDIRRVIGDDSRHPRFIKTIPKLGYRFIGTVEVIRPEDPLPGSNTHAPPGSLGKISLWFRTPAPRAAIITGLAATTVLGWIVLRLFANAPLEWTLPTVPGKKALAVMYFEDQSHRPDLKWLREGLADMFIADLAHSRSFNVLSRQQLQLLLDRAGRKPGRDVGLQAALEVARRSHAQAVILGSYATLGDRLLVSVQVFDRTGHLLTADRFSVDRIAEILGQVDVLSLKLMAQLSSAPAAGYPKPSLADAMTRNLEAYRYYSLGVAKAHRFENAQAIALLEKAIQLDPQFAMAYARIGYAYSVTDFVPEKGRPYLEKAFQLSDRLSEKDRLYVTAWYAIAREDYAAAIRTFRQIVLSYPLEIEAYSRLARLLYREELPDEAIAVVRQALTVDPDAGDLYNVLGILFLGTKRYNDAIAAHQRYVELAPTEPNAHDSLGMSYQQSGRYSEALAEYQAALRLNPEFEPAIIHIADTYAQLGRYRDAIGQYNRYIAVTHSNEAKAVAYGNIAQIYNRLHDFSQANAAAAEEAREEPAAVWNSLLLAIEQRKTASASALRDRLFADFPYPERGARNELRSYDYYRGMLALANGQSQEAIARFKEALGHLPPSSGLDLYEDCLGNAYLALDQPAAALAEYRRIYALNPSYPLLLYHMAAAYQQQGDERDAVQSYSRFLDIWNQADSDIPEIVEARRRLHVAHTMLPVVDKRRGSG
jgi:tetratricopeptide (TPR) repeat protein/DNA-binding winged helix-turn-helix (wHTH) protein